MKAIVIVTAADDPHGLLKEGPCGSGPPVVEVLSCGDGHPPIYRQISGMSADLCSVCSRRRRWVDARALVLHWDDKPVLSGLLRLWLAAGAGGDHPFPIQQWTTEDIARLAKGACEADPRIGRPVFLDAHAFELKR